MIVIDRTSFWALIESAPGSAIQRAIDACDAPIIFITQQTFEEATHGYVEEHGDAGMTFLADRMEVADITVVPSITARTAASQAAFEKYGKGHWPGSTLTLGDCAAYTRARSLDTDLVSERLSDYAIMGLEWMTVEYRLAEREKRLARLPHEIREKSRVIWRNRR